MLQNIIKQGKVSDQSLDIVKTSSLPTLLLNLLKGIQKVNLPEIQEIASEIIVTINEISKVFYTKAAGIDPIFIKGMLPLFAQLFKEPGS